MGCASSSSAGAEAPAATKEPPQPKDPYRGQRNAEGQRHGDGQAMTPDGTYMGQWADNEMEGMGTMRYKTGNVYEGQWKAGKMEGRGSYMYASGKAEVGCYYGGVDAGVGVRFSADRQRAVQLLNGQPQAEITPEDARNLTAEIGLRIPPPQPKRPPAAAADVQRM